MKSLEESARTLDDWYRIAADVTPGKPPVSVLEPLLDDLNTPLTIAALHGLRGDAAALAGSLRLLGFLSESAAQWEGRKQQASGVDVVEVERLIAERTAARGRKDFKESDRIRDLLAAMGVAIKDSKDGTTWEFSR
jgi:cysteinyl-tRNA synthetase